MLTRVSRLFVIKTKFEAFLVIYGLGTGAVERGMHYIQLYPGLGGKLLFAAPPVAVFMAAARNSGLARKRVCGLKRGGFDQARICRKDTR